MGTLVDDDAASVAPLDDDSPTGERCAPFKRRAVGATGVVGSIERLADDVDAAGPPVDLAHDFAALFGCLDVVAEVAVATDEKKQRE
jgi:hypothetical protein